MHRRALVVFVALLAAASQPFGEEEPSDWVEPLATAPLRPVSPGDVLVAEPVVQAHAFREQLLEAGQGAAEAEAALAAAAQHSAPITTDASHREAERALGPFVDTLERACPHAEDLADAVRTAVDALHGDVARFEALVPEAQRSHGEGRRMETVRTELADLRRLAPTADAYAALCSKARAGIHTALARPAPSQEASPDM